MFRSCRSSLVLIALLLTSLRAEEPRASVPILKVGDPAQTSFLAEGFIYNEDKRGIAFRIATDGKQHLFTMADAADGVPFFISNGDESLLYDLAQNQITFIPQSCFGFHISYRHTENSLSFQIAIQAVKDQLKRYENLPIIDLRSLPETAIEKLSKTISQTGTIVYEVNRAEKKRDRLEFHPEQQDWFCYSIYKTENEQPLIIIKATRIGQMIPPALLAMPDPNKFSNKCVWQEERVTDDWSIDKLINKQRFWVTKYMVAKAAKDDEYWKILVPNISRKELLERDTQLGAAYLQELQAQKFEPLEQPADFAKQQPR